MNKLEQISPDKYRVTDEETTTYSKTSLKRDVEKITEEIEDLERKHGIARLRSELERKQSIIDQMN